MLKARYFLSTQPFGNLGNKYFLWLLFEILDMHDKLMKVLDLSFDFFKEVLTIIQKIQS